MPRTIVDETPRPSLGAGRAMLDLIAELSLGPAAAMAFVARDTNRIAASDGRAALTALAAAHGRQLDEFDEAAHQAARRAIAGPPWAQAALAEAALWAAEAVEVADLLSTPTQHRAFDVLTYPAAQVPGLRAFLIEVWGKS